MSMQLSVLKHILAQKVKGNKKYPLVMMLEPLFACNLECAGCGKIQYPTDILRKRLSPEECWESAEECGAPVVSIAGGEPLVHPQIDTIVEGLIARRNHHAVNPKGHGFVKEAAKLLGGFSLENGRVGHDVKAF